MLLELNCNSHNSEKHLKKKPKALKDKVRHFDFLAL